jgi:phasin family protein
MADTDLNPFRDLSKTFEQFKMPGVDMAAFVDARRQDVEAMVAANKVTYEALQSLAHTQRDMLTQAMQDMQAQSRAVLSQGPGGGKLPDMAQHTEAAQKAWQKMLADMKRLADMVGKAQADALAGLGERAAQQVAAVTGAAGP